MDAVILLVLLLVSILIGAIGSLLGIGGGVFLIPIMTLGLGIDIKVAAATSLVTIIVTSSSSAPRYLREGLVNVKLGMFLEIFTVTGAIIGAFLVSYLNANIVEGIFALVMIYAAYYMQIRMKDVSSIPDQVPPSRFNGRYRDEGSGELRQYGVKNMHRGAAAGFVAGNLSGLIGVGGGIVKVPAMHIWMGVPMKAAAATSNFMIGVTAVASALVYLANGLVAPVITASAAIGIFIGATMGSRMMGKITGRGLRTIFSVILIAISVIMFLRAGGIF